MSQRTLSILSECIPIFTMLQDENRQTILMLLFDAKEMSVTELTEQLSLSRPAVSHHLKLLLDSRLVEVTKVGKERYYRISMENAVQQLKALLQSLENDIHKSSE